MTKLPFPHEPKRDDWTTFIQWKGTDVCMDWYCPNCGKHNHEDRDFMYEVQCYDDTIENVVLSQDEEYQKGCGAVFMTGSEIKLYPLDTEKYKRWKDV